MTQEFEGSAPPVQLPPSPPRSRIAVVFRRSLLVAGLGSVALIGLVLVAWLVENQRGRSAWEKYRTDLTGKGEKLELAAVVAAPVPESDNFAATPLLTSMFSSSRTPGGKRTSDPAAHERAEALANPFPSKAGAKTPGKGSWETATPIDLESWQAFFEQHPLFRSGAVSAATNAGTAVLTALQYYDAELTELATAAARPASVFPLRYEDNFNMQLPHLTPLKGAVTIVRLRALARLQTGQTQETLRDVQLAFRIGQALKDEPLIISQLVRIVMLQLALQPVWEGLLHRRWNESQLAQLQEMLASTSLLDGYGRCLRGERYFANATMSARGRDASGVGVGPMFRLAPSGWIQQNQVSLGRFYQERMLPIIDAEHWRAYPDRAAAAESAPELKRRTPYNIETVLLLPAVVKTPIKFAHRQSSLDLAATACALERSYLAQGSYPEKLENLPPELTRGLHGDLITGEALKYARTPDGRYTLYSVGWNQADDQGETMHSSDSNAIVPDEGDWVWKYAP